ncbi:hypothetical protein GFY24_23510 [Nocardia sp. SYP-A9097]|uniref:hypothetical protein n=1 Tax=Nocardia sp. SYP-A9097 TaxID=2663237 RepID=UPI00129B0723|nr:hypothetical protein [Nocardia sp. SYP-A9097]MRH90372.1 hypothetical protein [Nocardia sp. SYP-A9097]
MSQDAEHLAALRIQQHSEPLRLRRFDSGDPTLAEHVDQYLANDFGRGHQRHS